jgi:hypothetical protein
MPGIMAAQGGVELGLNFVSPADEFREATNMVGAGLNLNVSVPISKEMPFTMGFEFGYLLFGSHIQRDTLQAQVIDDGQVVDVIEMPLRLTTNNNLYHGHISLRAEAPLKIVRPYIEVLAGLRYYNTRTKVLDDTPDGRWSERDGNKVLVKQQQLGDLVGSYGFGGGVLIDLKEQIKLNLRFDYLKGGKAKFYDPEDTEKWQVSFISDESWDPSTATGEDLVVSAQPREANTNSYFVTVGLSFPLKFDEVSAEK